MSHNLQRLGKLLIKPTTWDRPTPAAPPSADKSGETHPKGQVVFRVTHQAERPAPTLPASPRPTTSRLTVVLAAGEACGAVADGGLSTHRARGGKFPEEISDEGAPQGHFLHRRPRRRRG